MGMALSGCTPPAKGTPIFTLADNEMEMGVGIHGEPGRARKPFVSANEIVDEIVDAILDRPQADRGRRHGGARRSRAATKWR